VLIATAESDPEARKLLADPDLPRVEDLTCSTAWSDAARGLLVRP
jgi:hypothetical protein